MVAPMEWKNNLDLYPKYLHARLKKKRGLGIGKTYKPWHGLREGKRKGTTGLPFGIKTGRMHDLQSHVHRAYFFLLERQADVLDIRERFPILHIPETLELCAKHGVDHPYSGDAPEPLLLDFLVTREIDGQPVVQARCLVAGRGKRAEVERSQLVVKHAWCAARGIDWKRVETDGLTTTFLDSLIFVRGWFRHRYKPDEASVSAFVRAFKRLHRRELSLAEILELCAAKIGQDYERCANHFRYAAWTKQIPIDLRFPLIMNEPVVLRDKTRR